MTKAPDDFSEKGKINEYYNPIYVFFKVHTKKVWKATYQC